MSIKMLVNATQHEENRVAIVEDGTLTELDIEVAGYEPTKGNIYRAVVVRVESGLQAAFVDYGAERLGFLQIDEINYKTVKPDYQPAEDGRRPRITDLLQRGQEILVQITKEERGTKGAALTTYLSLAGRYMVIMPGSKTRGVSRKAESDAQRKQLKEAMASIEMAENTGYIVRTAALNQTREELERDYRYLIRLYESILELNKKVKAPALLYKESNLIIRSIRDYFTTEMDEVLIDDPEVFKEAKDFFQMVMPDHVNLVKLHQERRPIFSRYQIEDQIETLSRNKVPLPSGGSIVIDPTEALVAIDVNSGKMASEQNVEATATKTNIEAAREVGRQLRLRDLGGLVVIDFIDMRDRKHAREVENELKKSLQNDKARVSVGRISQFGLLEMSRQRIKGALAEGTYLTCHHCQGSGRLKSPETQAASLLRKIHASAAKGQISKIDAHLPPDVAVYLLNSKRQELADMERDHHLQIHIHGDPDFLADQIELEIIKKEKDKPAQPEFVAAGLLPAPVEDDIKKQDAEAPKQEEAEPAKKRRRRRRRKPANTETTQPEQQDPVIEVAEATEQEEAKSSEGNTAEKEPADNEEKQKKKPQRRRRSQSRKQDTQVSSEVEKPTAKDQTEQLKKQQGAPDSANNSEPVTENGDESASSKEQKTASKTKPARPQRKPRKTAQAASTKDTGIENSSPATNKEESTTLQEPEPKPKRRPRRTTAKSNKDKNSPQSTAVKEVQAKPDSSSGDGVPTPKSPTEPAGETASKPKPRRGRPRKNAAKTEEKKDPVD